MARQALLLNVDKSALGVEGDVFDPEFLGPTRMPTMHSVVPESSNEHSLQQPIDTLSFARYYEPPVPLSTRPSNQSAQNQPRIK